MRSRRFEIDQQVGRRRRGWIEDIDDTGEVVALADGRVQEHATFAKAILNRLQEGGELDVFRIHLVDDQKPGHAAFAGLGEHAARIHFDAVDRGNDDGSRFDRFERLERCAHEVGIARSIEQVDLFALVFEVKDARVDGEMTTLFLVVIVGDAGTVFYAALAIDSAGFEKKGVRQRRLARRPMSNERNVPDVLDFVLGHELLPVMC